MEVKFKRMRPQAILPTYATEGSAGLDLTGVWYVSKGTDDVCIGTGLAVEIPEGHIGLLFARSSIRNYDMILSNAVGIIDSDYRGEILMAFKVTNRTRFKIYQLGERIGQLVIVPHPRIEIIESDKLSDTNRGHGGYGSSGK